jgi:nucleosome assembly protein 1-like 1
MEMLEVDYERGEIMKEKLINNAVKWFTGEALEEFEEEYGESDEDEEEYDEDEDEDDDEDDVEGPTDGATAQAPECKQQ